MLSVKYYYINFSQCVLFLAIIACSLSKLLANWYSWLFQCVESQVACCRFSITTNEGWKNVSHWNCLTKNIIQCATSMILPSGDRWNIFATIFNILGDVFVSGVVVGLRRKMSKILTNIFQRSPEGKFINVHGSGDR